MGELLWYDEEILSFTVDDGDTCRYHKGFLRLLNPLLANEVCCSYCQSYVPLGCYVAVHVMEDDDDYTSDEILKPNYIRCSECLKKTPIVSMNLERAKAAAICPPDALCASWHLTKGIQ